MKLANRFYSQLVRHRSIVQDSRRRELILNILLISMLIAGCSALIIAVIQGSLSSVGHHSTTLELRSAFTGFILILIFTSRRGKYLIATLAFIGLLALVALHLLFAWGYMLPNVLLLELLIIVVCGILLNARAGLIAAVACALITITAGFLHQAEILLPNTGWTADPWRVTDALGYAILFLIIGMVSWLSNSEIDYSLQRARVSEVALKKERDSLELKVLERTKEFEQAQFTRFVELQRLAEFGRISANLIHEIANPLTAAKMNLEMIDTANTRVTSRLHQNLRQMERFLYSTRQQIHGGNNITRFSVGKEIRQVINILAIKATKEHVKVRLEISAPIRLTGDAVKFNQIIANLIANGIESYAASFSPVRNRLVKVTAQKSLDEIKIQVWDTGCGLTNEQSEHLFDPFYTSKAKNQQSLGIGLVMVKRFTEEAFKGTVTADYSSGEGTTFTVKIPLSTT